MKKLASLLTINGLVPTYAYYITIFFTCYLTNNILHDGAKNAPLSAYV